MTVIPALIGGGMSILGGLLGGSSASKQAKAERQAAADTRAYAEKQMGLGGLGQLAAMLGPEGIQRWLAQTDPALVQQLVRQEAQNPTFNAQQQARYEEIERELQKPVLATATGQGPAAIASRLLGNGGRSITPQQRDALEAEKAALWSAAGGRVGKSGIDLEALKALGPGLVGKYRQEAADADAQGARNLSRYDAGTYELGRMASDIERSASQFGRQQTERARRDAKDSLANSNALATSSLMGRGLGASTALTGALRGNAEQNQRALADTLGGLEDQQIRLRTGLQGNRMSLLQSRDSGRNAMMLGGQDASRSLRLGALNVEQAALAGSDPSRQLGSMAPTFFSSASPSGQYLGVLGGGLAGAGSQLFGYGLGGLTNGSVGQPSLDQMRQWAAMYGGMPN
ncbi:MAG: hypothetical protein IT432_13830 [Phycisphaerales bacterium]|nr:hypothetical protein [Phycisphaerales bacterium]